MLNPKRDGHIHSPYCPHGTKDSLQSYVEVALQKGLEEITFTEHMPFPDAFYTLDPVFHGECSPTKKHLEGYFEEIQALKQKMPQLMIHAGLEVDYIEGYEKETTQLLEMYGPLLEDSLLSIHFVFFEGEYYAIDYLPSVEKLLKRLGSIENVYEQYYQTVLKAIQCELGPYKPKRIGHIELVKRFQQNYPCEYKNLALFEEIIKNMKIRGYALDYNTSGLRKKECQEVYVTQPFYALAMKYDIPMVYGSDAHQSNDVGAK